MRVKKLQKYSSALYYIDFVSFNKLKLIFAKADLYGPNNSFFAYKRAV